MFCLVRQPRLNNSITNPFRAQMMQQSSAPCFSLPFFGKKKGYSGRKDKKRTVWGKRNDKPPPAPHFFYIARQFHRLHCLWGPGWNMNTAQPVWTIGRSQR